MEIPQISPDFIPTCTLTQSSSVQNMHRNKLLARLIENLPIGVILTDAKGNCLIASSQMREIWCRGSFNKPVESFHDVDLGMFHMDNTPYKLDDWPLHRAIKYLKPVPTELIKVKTVSRQYFVEISASPVTENGELLYVFILWMT